MEIYIEGRKIVVEEIGEKENIPVIMIPAIGRPASDFRLLAEDLAEEGYFSLMFNCRGINGSTGLDTSLRIEDVANDVYLFLKEIGAPKAHFVGHAFGTRVARMMAEKYPEVALSSTSITMGGFLAPQLPYPLLALDMIKNKQNGTPEFEKTIMEAYFAEGNDGSIWFDGWNVEAIPSYTLALTRTPIEELLCAGNAPMLIVQGENDVFAPIKAGEIMKQNLKEQVRVVNLPKAGHEILHEQPKLTSKAIIEFLKDVDNKKFFSNNIKNSTYSLGWSDAVTKFQSKRTFYKYGDFLLPHIKKNAKILDCGCGIGTMTIELAMIDEEVSVYGIDMSDKQIEHANKLKKDKNLNNITFKSGDIYKLPFEDSSFDIVWMNTLLMHLSKPIDALKEAYRVLKPGGIIGVSDADWEGDIVVPKFNGVLESIESTEKLFKENGSNMRKGKYNAFFLNKAGFKNVSITTIEDCWASEEEKKSLAEFSIAMQEELFSDKITELQLSMRKEAWSKWTSYPGSFFSRVYCRAIGWKDNA